MLFRSPKESTSSFCPSLSTPLVASALWLTASYVVPLPLFLLPPASLPSLQICSLPLTPLVSKSPTSLMVLPVFAPSSVALTASGLLYPLPATSATPITLPILAVGLLKPSVLTSPLAPPPTTVPASPNVSTIPPNALPPFVVPCSVVLPLLSSSLVPPPSYLRVPCAVD